MVPHMKEMGWAIFRDDIIVVMKHSVQYVKMCLQFIHSYIYHSLHSCKLGTNSSEEGSEVQQFTIYIASTPGQYTVSYLCVLYVC